MTPEPSNKMQERETVNAKGKGRVLSPAITRPFALFVAALREIFDESAYRRFLKRSNSQSSSNAYALFRQENEQLKSRRPKCC